MKMKKLSAIFTAAMLSVSLLPMNVSAYEYEADYGTDYGYEYENSDDYGSADAAAEENVQESAQESLSGKIRIKGEEKTGEKLSVDFSEMKPEWVTEDALNFTWFAANPSDVANDMYNDDLMIEVGYSSEYTVVDEDAGSVIVVKVEGKEGSGLAGELYAKTDVITGTAAEEEMLGAGDDFDDMNDPGVEDFENELSDMDGEWTDDSLEDEWLDSQSAEELNSEDEWLDPQPEEDQNPEDGWLDPQPEEEQNSEDEWLNSQSEENLNSDDEWNDDEDDWLSDEDDSEIDWNVQDELLGADGSDWEVFGGDDSETEPGEEEPGEPESEDPDSDEEWGDLEEGSDGEDPLYGEEPLEPDYEFSVDPLKVEFELEEGYTEESRTISVTNTGSEEFELSASCTAEENCLQLLDQNGNAFTGVTLGASGTENDTCVITVALSDGLAAREIAYEGSIILSDGKEEDNTTVSVAALITAVPEPVSSVSVKVEGEDLKIADFGTWSKDEIKTSKTVEVTNTGEVAAVVDLSASGALQYFTVSQFAYAEAYDTVLQPGEYDQFVITPNYNSLDASDSPYEETFPLYTDTVDGQIDLLLSIFVEQAAPSAKEYVGVVKPSAVGPLPNGISLEDIKSSLPTNVLIRTKKDGVEEKEPVSVTWDLSTTSYKPGNQDKQTFDVIGYFSLPTDVENPGEKPLNTTVNVVVAKAVQKNEVLEVRQPASLINQPNGISKANLLTRLPANIQIKTSQNGWIGIRVNWDMAGAAYDPAVKAAQEFYVNGYYSLPAGVTDPSNLTRGGATSVYVSVAAAPKKNNLVEIIDPKPLLNQPNGIAKKDLAAKIPSMVQIVTSLNGTMNAEVKWNYKNCPYDPNSQTVQNFIVQGMVILPEGVYNLNSIPLSTSISIEVSGRKPIIAQESANTITGLDTKNGYLVGTPISFTAVGAGMDNTSPEVGDVRYVPAKWKITNTYEWTQAPYTGQFKITQPGNYSLAVYYRREVYNGKAWEADGQVSQKNFSFRVYTNGPALTVTPLVTQKPSVPTGDTTPIAMWIAILAIAAACIAGGVILYIKKRK